MKDVDSDLWEYKDGQVASYKWMIGSSGPYDLYYRMGITKFDRVFVVYKPEHSRNMAKFYERLLEKWDSKNNFYGLIRKNIGKIRFVLDIIDKGLEKNLLKDVPEELMSLYDNWGWVETGFGIKEGGVISHYYGITTNGIAVQILDKAIFQNLVRGCYYMMLAPYEKEPSPGNFLHALFCTDTALDFICESDKAKII
jgi:hypothetical protein